MNTAHLLSKAVRHAAACALALLSFGAIAQDKVTIMTDWSPHGMHAGLHLAASIVGKVQVAAEAASGCG